MCNKIGYESKDDARKDAKEITAHMGWFNRSKGRKGRLRPYLCKRCGSWHLTSKKSRKKPFSPAWACLHGEMTHIDHAEANTAGIYNAPTSCCAESKLLVEVRHTDLMCSCWVTEKFNPRNQGPKTPRV